MANDDFEKLPATTRQPGYHKLVKTTSETSKTTREEHESRDDASGRYEKRLVASETRESKTTLSEIREPSAPARELPARWRTSLPDKVRIRLRGVEPAGCADAEAFDGEYILELLESRAEQCRWELTLSPKCHLYRICLVALPADGQAVELRAFFEGSEAAPGWKGTVDSSPLARVTLEFDDSRATNPVAGCIWPQTIEIEPIGPAPPGRFKIPAAPTPAELARMAFASSSGCTSSGPAGYSILGPRHVPGLSEYTYQLDAPAGVGITNIVGTVNKPTASIVGAADELQVLVRFQNTTPDYIRIRASFDADGQSESVQICIALVQVIVATPTFSAPGVAGAASANDTPFLVDPPPPPATPTWVTEHDPGSDCAAFTYNGTTQAPEPQVQVLSNGGGGGPAFTAVAMVSLVAPPEKPDAVQYIEVGWLQNLDPVRRKAFYTTTPAGGERVYTVPTFSTIDWLSSPCSPGPTDVWPWYDRTAMARGSGLGTWTFPAPGIPMADSPSLAIPAEYNPNDPSDPNRNAPLTTATGTKAFSLHMSARTIDSDLGASDHYFSIGHTGWDVNFTWPVASPPASIVTLPDPSIDWIYNLQPGNEDIVDVVPGATDVNIPYRRWIPQMAP